MTGHVLTLATVDDDALSAARLQRHTTVSRHTTLPAAGPHTYTAQPTVPSLSLSQWKFIFIVQVLNWKKVKEIHRSENCCNWNWSVWLSRRVDWNVLDMLNVRMMRTVSNAVGRWRLMDRDRKLIQGRLDGTVLTRIWRVWACAKRGINGEGESSGQWLTQAHFAKRQFH